MSTPIDTPAEEALTELAERFEHWRRTRPKGRARIPEDLWDQAVALRPSCPMGGCTAPAVKPHRI